jgi:transcriptional regulator with XRE-family HTH domain
MERIRKQLRKARRDLEMSQQELADRVGVTRAHISNIEHGKTVPTVETLEKIANALGITVEIGSKEMS